MWKQMLSDSNGMLNVYWNHWHPLHNGLYTTLYMPTCHFVCLDIGYLDQSGWGGEDCWCQVQDIWLWVSHRIQLTGHWVGQGQDGELAVVLVSNNYCFDFMLLCLLQLDDAGHIKNSEIAKELSLPPVKLHCSSKYHYNAMYFTFSDSVSDYSITNKISQELKISIYGSGS